MAITHPSIKASDGKPVSVAVFPRTDRRTIIVQNLTMAYGNFVMMKDINFTVKRGDIFIIMGGSGCGKSTLLRHLIGLIEPATGEIWYGDFNFTKARAGTARGDAAPLRRAVPGRRAVELDDAGGKHRTAARRIHRSVRRGNSRGRLAQAGAGRAQGLRGLLSQPDQRRDAEAGGIGARDRARPGDTVSSTSRRPASIRSARACSTT